MKATSITVPPAARFPLLWCVVTLAATGFSGSALSQHHAWARDEAVAIDTDAGAKYWIFFRDKLDSSGKKATPVEISDEAVTRRETRGRTDNVEDLDVPVSSLYLDRLESAGIAPVVRSRWLNAVSAVLAPSELEIVRSMPFVKDVRLVGVSLMERSVPMPQTATIRDSYMYARRRLDYGPSLAQLELVNAVGPIEEGINGSGVILGFLDTTYGGFSHPVFEMLVDDGRMLGEMDFTLGGGTNTHGMSVASVAVGFSEGDLIGPAHGASVLAATTEWEPTETNQEEDNFVAGLEWLESQGVDVVNTSLGYTTFDAGQNSYEPADLDGNTAVTTIASDLAASLGVIVVTSAGNDAGCGSPTSCWYYVSTPADGDSVIAVGGTDASGARASFSGRGPTADGRTKPDVAALATNVQVAQVSSAFGFSAGTSFASPMIAGIVAQMLEVNPGLGPTDVMDILRMTASRYQTPDNELGWGIVDAEAAIAFAIQVSTHNGGGHAPTLTVLPPYPNPGNTRISLGVLIAGGSTPLEVSLHDVLGRLVSRTTVHADAGRTDIELDVSLLPSGPYFVLVADGRNTDATPISVVR